MVPNLAVLNQYSYAKMECSNTVEQSCLPVVWATFFMFESSGSIVATV